MGKMHTFFFLLLALLLSVACGEQLAEPTSTPAPTPLPTAVPPSGDASGPAAADTGDWAVGFGHEFPGEFWESGRHRYGFRIQCNRLNYDLAGEWHEFVVTEEVAAQPFPLYLRLGGLSANEFTPAYLADAYINPIQETTAVVYLVGLSEGAAKRARTDCEVIVGWDQGSAQMLEPLEPFQP